MKKIAEIFYCFVILVTFFGCATSVPVQVTRPAELDLNGANTISVLPFATSSKSNINDSDNIATIIMVGILDILTSTPASQDEINCANYLTDSITRKLSSSSYLTLISSSAVEKALSNKSTAPCDVYLTGKITDFTSELKTEEVTEEVKGVEVLSIKYKRKVSFDLTYQIIDSSNNSVISYKTTSLSATSDLYKNSDNIPTAYSIIKSKIDTFANTVLKQIQPYTVTKNITLLKDKTKDPDMKTANELAKNGFLNKAQEMYLSLYYSVGYFEAGYNAAMLMQAQGDLYKAEDLILELLRSYNDKRASKALKDIDYEISLAEKLKSQNAARQN